MNESNRQSLPTSYPSGPQPPLNHSFSGSTTVDSWMTTAPSAGQPLPSYATLPNQNEFDIRQGYHSGIPSPGPAANGAPNFIHHSYIQQPYLNSKYGSTPDYSQSHFSSNLYNSYANNYVSKVDISSKHSADNSDGGNDTHMEEVCGSDGNTAEGLTARLLDKNSDNGPIASHSPSSQDSGSNSVGYRPWEQPGADGQPLAQDQTNAQQIQSHPTRPSSAQSDKTQHPSQRTTPSPARRTGRSPSAQQFGDNHPIEKYQTLTPVPPIPPISAPYNPGMYGQPSPVVYPNHMGVTPYMQTQFSTGFPAPDGKQLKMGITEPDSSTPDVRMGALENSFQVPSVSSTTRPSIGGIPQPSATPPHPQTAQQVVSIHPTPQAVNEQWEAANQIPVPQNVSQQTPGEGEKVTKKKRKRCGECPGCLKKDNCGECGPCKSVRSHQICKMRKCDQLKTKKEKVREAAQLAAAAAQSGLTLTKDMTALDGSSRNLNGTTISTPFTNLGPSDAHSAGVGPTPRGSYPEFSATKQPNINQVFDSNAQTFQNFHNMNPQPITGPFNGHVLVPEVNLPHHSPENTVNSDNTHQNRHQIMNNRLKTLIQSRQNQKELSSGQNHNFSSGPVQTPHTPQPPSFAGQTFIVVQQQSNANNTSLSPHYGNTSVPPNSDTGQSFLHMNWSQQEADDNAFHKTPNGISDKMGGIQTGRRTSYNSIELQNGSIYHSFSNNSHFNNTNESQNNSNNNTKQQNNSKINGNHKNSSNNTNSQFIPTTTYSSNQSQSFTSPTAQEYSSNETNASLPASQPRQPTQRPSSRSSPARAVNNSSANNVTKAMIANTEPMANISANSVNRSQSQPSNDQTLENEPFLGNTTTTMHLNHNHHNHNLSDLTTSMNTSTGIISSYNLSPHSQSSAFYPSSLYMPSMGLLGHSSPTVIMSVSDTGLDSSKKSLEEPQSSVGHMISGIDCGRIDIEPLDSNSGLNLMDLTSMTSFIKSDPLCDPTSSSSPLLLSSESQYTMTSLSNVDVNSTSMTTVLPPVSTFLLPNFRDQNWWDRNLDKLKTNTKDISDCECYAPDEREYIRSASPSSLTTTLPASLSN